MAAMTTIVAERKLAIGFGLALLVLGANALVSYNDLAVLVSNTHSVVRSREVLEGVEDVASAFKDVESARRGYLVDGNLDDLNQFEEYATIVLDEIETLDRLAMGRGPLLTHCLKLDRSARDCLDQLRLSIEKARQRGLETAREAFGRDPLRARLTNLFLLIEQIERNENQYLEDRLTERRATVNRAFATFSVASTLALILIGTIFQLGRRYLADRKRAELTLRESEATVRLLLDSAGEGVYGVDLNGCCTFCNPSALELLGYQRDDEVLGRNMHSLIHHTRHDGQPFAVGECPIYQVFHSGEGTLGEEDIFWRADGTPFPVEYRAHPIRRDGHSLGAVVTFVDVEPKRRAEMEMRLRDRALKAIAQGVFITDPARSDEPIIYVNAAFERLTGFTLKEAAGRNIDFLQGPETDPKAIARIQTAFLERRETSVSMLSYRKDGTKFWDALTIAPVEDLDGRVTHFVGVVTDITETKRYVHRIRDSEERLRLMIESVRDYAIFAIDLDGQVSSWNSGAERLFGYGDSEILGQPAESLFTPEDRAAGIPSMEISQAGITGRSEDERWHVRKDGTRFFASGTVTAVHDESGSLLGYTKVARDVTESKRAEAELRSAKEAAEAASRAKSTFLANMSHELRTPLNAIIGYSEILEEEAHDRELDDFIPDLDRIRSAGKHLLGLINDVLDLSKIEAGRMDLYLETFDVAVMIQDLLHSIMPLAERAGDTLQVDCPADLGVMRADLTKVRQGLLNLLSNAVKFTERGTILLKASREVAEDGQDRILLSVTDDGIGMTGDEITRLFRPFVQADVSTTRRYGGTGLGLTITRRYCQLMGGDISVTSTPGKGSTFTLTLPALVPAQAVDRSLAESPKVRPDPESTTILVINEDANERGITRRFFEREGWSVVEADNELLGLEQLEKTDPDLVIDELAWPLPARLDGLADLRHSANGREVAILVVVPADLSADERARLMPLADGLIIKGPEARDNLKLEVRRRLFDKPRANLVSSPAFANRST